MREKFEKLSDMFKDKLRSLCDKIPLELRFTIILLMFTVMLTTFLLIFTFTLYNATQKQAQNYDQNKRFIETIRSGGKGKAEKDSSVFHCRDIIYNGNVVDIFTEKEGGRQRR